VNSVDAVSNNGPDQVPAVDADVPVCRSLRFNGMYVFTEGQPDDADDADDARIYWCFHTMKSFGPDDAMVGRRQCRNSARGCYEAL
jgi:hypothetical protein